MISMCINNIKVYINKLFSEVDVTNIFLMLMLAAMLFYPLLFVGFTTRDDAELAISFGKSVGLFETSRLLAESQGRFAFFWAYPLMRLPYFIDSAAWYLTFKIGASLFVLIAMYFALVKVFKSAWLACMSLLFFLALIQNGWDHNALTSYPVAFNAYAILFLFSIGLFAEAIDRDKLSLAIVSGVLYFFSIGIELFVLLYPLYIAVLLSRVQPDERMMPKLWASKKYLLATAIPLVLYLLIYVSWRSFHPSGYDGNSLNGSSLWAACKVIFAYSLSALPFVSLRFLLSPGSQLQFSDLAGLSGILSQLSLASFLKPAIVGFLFIRLMRLESCNVVPKARTLIISAAVVFVSIFVPNLLLGFVQKHQMWVAAGSYSYLYTYYSFIFAVIFAALVAAYLNVSSRSWKPRLRSLMIFLMFFVVVFLSFAVEVRNQYIAFDQKLSHRKWQLMDAVIKSPEFMQIPDGSIVLVPTVTAHHRGIASVGAGYWSDYVKYMTGQNIQFRDVQCDIALPCYSLVFQQALHSDNQFIVLSKMTPPELLFSSELTIYYMPSEAGKVMMGSFLAKDAVPKLQLNGVDVGHIVDGLFLFTLPRVSNQEFVQTAKLKANVEIYPDQITASNYGFAPRIDPFSIDLGDGFYGWETIPNAPKWAWSKDASTLQITNYDDKPVLVAVKFEATALENIELSVSEGASRTFMLTPGTYQPIAFEVKAQPGVTDIHLHSNRKAELPKNGDERLLSFSVRNLQLGKP
jgi:hypothetical protein